MNPYKRLFLIRSPGREAFFCIRPNNPFVWQKTAINNASFRLPSGLYNSKNNRYQSRYCLLACKIFYPLYIIMHLYKPIITILNANILDCIHNNIEVS